MLALFCRCENNRYYLKRKVEVRTGFLAKWIEFIIHEVPQDEYEYDNWLVDKIIIRLTPSEIPSVEER